MASGGDEAAAASKRPLSFLDLPIETQHDIFSHCSQSDLVCLAVVSKHFHEVASSKLYRNFHIVFPDDDEIDFDSPIDGLAGGLDTFTTSEYNYAKHLRDLSMDTLSPGRKGEQSYQPYLYSATCGKFFNTLLYLTLKKARALEVFTWNVRIELTRPVYRELHNIPTIKRVHIRLQAGESYYAPLPPLPISMSPHPAPPVMSGHWHAHSDGSPSHYGHGPLYSLYHSSSSAHPPSKPFSRSKSLKKAVPLGPATFSGFKNLQSLTVLDIDTLDLVSELQTCVKKSYSTLTELQLSFSDALATKSRRPLMDSDSEESDLDEFPHNNSHNYESTRPAKVYRANEEKKLQDLLLARVFDVDPGLVKKPQIQPHPVAQPEPSNNGEESQQKPDDNEAQQFIDSWKAATERMMTTVNGCRDFSAQQRATLDIIEQAARKYVGIGAQPSSDDEEAPPPWRTQRSLAGSSQEEVTLKNTVYTPRFDWATMPRSVAPLPHRPVQPVHDEGEPAKFCDMSNSPDEASEDEVGDMKQQVDDYIRTTRGISLEVLSLHLVPVRPAVLSRAINLNALRSLTLLNVGPQSPIWNLLSKENEVQPLALRSVFTDNASFAFLSCMSQLEELHDLFMLQRSVDHKPESFATRAATSIDQIRRLVLKKHIKTLKRLMIKDESKEANWDANEKTMILLCNQGMMLEELALSMNIHAVHAFMQYFAGLVNLRAINILHFKNSNTCPWVVREMLQFIVDNLSHQPEMKLEWIAMEDDRVNRVVRPSEANDIEGSEAGSRPKSAQSAGKARAIDVPQKTYPDPPLDQDRYGSETEDEDDVLDGGRRLRFQTEGPLQFYDVWGVKIFEKEIRSGRL